jgi:hypothetical protein
MSEDKRSKSTKVVSSLIGPVLLGMFGAVMAIQITDRFASTELIESFYSEVADATCVLIRSRGQEVMSCIPGDRRKSQDDAND